MLVHVTAVLTTDELREVRARLGGGEWADGRVTAGYRSAAVKANVQLPQSDPQAQESGQIILRALERNATFISATLPHHVYPPLFNRYAAGMSFGDHVDNAVRQVPGTSHRLRTDLSATLFLSEPSEYDGGELVIEDTYGSHSVKLAAGDLVGLLLAGAFLLLALRAALTGAPWPSIAIWLLAALIAHLADLVRRWRK